jgi:hypothetical protein
LRCRQSAERKDQCAVSHDEPPATLLYSYSNGWMFTDF